MFFKGSIMAKRKRNGIDNDTSTKKRRDEIASLLAAGMLKTETAIKPLSKKLSDSSQKALEL
jgi:hypothetical protein